MDYFESRYQSQRRNKNRKVISYKTLLWRKKQEAEKIRRKEEIASKRREVEIDLVRAMATIETLQGRLISEWTLIQVIGSISGQVSRASYYVQKNEPNDSLRLFCALVVDILKGLTRSMFGDKVYLFGLEAIVSKDDYNAIVYQTGNVSETAIKYLKIAHPSIFLSESWWDDIINNS